VTDDGGLLRPDSAVVHADAPAGPDLERIVARLLTAGTYVSVAILAVGTVLMVAGGVQPLSGWTPFDLNQLGDDLAHLRPAGFLWLGLAAVIATPAGRVGASLAGYLRGGERLMALIAVLVLAVIVLSVGLATTLEP
jgi:uncharacterized membrane protein